MMVQRIDVPAKCPLPPHLFKQAAAGGLPGVVAPASKDATVDLVVPKNATGQRFLAPFVRLDNAGDSGTPTSDTVPSLLVSLLNDATAVPSNHSPEVLNELLGALHEKWILPNLEASGLREHAYTAFDLPLHMDVDDQKIQQAYVAAVFQATRVYLLFLTNDLIGIGADVTTDEEGGEEYRRKFNTIFQAIVHMYEMVSAEHRIRALTDAKSSEREVPKEINLFRFSFPDSSENNEFQNLLLFILHRTHKQGLARYRGACYSQIRTKEGHYTHAWQHAMNIKTLIYKSVRKELNYQQWFNMTRSKDNVRAAVSYLEDCNDIEFPQLEPDRHLFAYRNGLYNVKTLEFFPYAAVTLPAEYVACHYHDVDFPYQELAEMVSTRDWYDIPTPSLQRVFEHQDLPEEAVRWAYVFLGRMMFDVNELDEWQVMPYIKGVAGSGKSTMCRVAAGFYHERDVGTLSNNMEKKFGLSAIHDKFLFICPEVRGNMGLDQAEMQSMVSGESMSIAVKFKDAINKQWKVPGMMCGNEMPDYSDTGNSVGRRWIAYQFNKLVENPDPMLFRNIKENTARVMCKCATAYHWAVNKVQKDLWKELPAYFRETRDANANELNLLCHFLNQSDAIDVAANGDDDEETYYMSWSQFQDLYNAHCAAIGHAGRSPALKPDIYNHIFEQKGISVSNGPEAREWGGRIQTLRYVNGVRERRQGGMGAA